MRVVCLLLTVTALAGCRDSASWPPDGGQLRTFASIPPAAYLVERIGGPHVQVGVLVGPGQSPHTFEPTPRQVAALCEAQAFFTIGLPFERLIVAKLAATRPELRVVDLRDGIELLPAVEHVHEAVAAQSEPGASGGHAHGEDAYDPHFWLDPQRARIAASTIAIALQQLDPSHGEEYAQRLAGVQVELAELDARIAARLAPFHGREFFVFHPAYGYFADRYGLKQVAIETAGKEPGARRLTHLIERARAARARVIFYEPQFSAAAAQAVARELGARVIPLDPQARDYLRNLDDIAAKTEEALRP